MRPFEHRSEPLLPRPLFLRRMARHGAIGLGLIAGSLGIGVLGYHHFLFDPAGPTRKHPWVDALLNASMILTGMGPVDPMPSPAGKLFASFYALFSGVVFLTIVGVVLAPVFHRFLHRFHLGLQDDDTPPG